MLCFHIRISLPLEFTSAQCEHRERKRKTQCTYLSALSVCICDQNKQPTKGHRLHLDFLLFGKPSSNREFLRDTVNLASE